MAVLVGSISGVFLYCFGHRKKRKLTPGVHENTPFWPQNLKKVSGEGHSPSPDPSLCGKGRPPFHTLPPLAPSAPRLGSRLQRSTLPPTLTPGSSYDFIPSAENRVDILCKYFFKIFTRYGYILGYF